MIVRNCYAKRAKISESKFRQIIRYFSVDLDASQITRLVGLNRNSVNRYLRAIRERIAEFCETQSPFSGEIEVDESFFGARRIKGKRGRGLKVLIRLLDKPVLWVKGVGMIVSGKTCRPSNGPDPVLPVR